MSSISNLMTQLHHIYEVLHWTKIYEVFHNIYEAFHKYDEASPLSVLWHIQLLPF